MYKINPKITVNWRALLPEKKATIMAVIAIKGFNIKCNFNLGLNNIRNGVKNIKVTWFGRRDIKTSSVIFAGPCINVRSGIEIIFNWSKKFITLKKIQKIVIKYKREILVFKFNRYAIWKAANG